MRWSSRARRLLAAAVAVATLAGCGSTPREVDDDVAEPGTRPASATADWPLPPTGRSVLVALGRMPGALGAWEGTDADRGMVFYDHPDGQLGIDAAELGDLFVDRVDAAEAVARLGAALDPGTARACASPPAHCVLGEVLGQPGMIWGHDRSKILLTAVWPDDESRDLLARAWAEAQG